MISNVIPSANTDEAIQPSTAYNIIAKALMGANPPSSIPQNKRGRETNANAERLAIVGERMANRLVRIKGINACHCEAPLPSRKSYWPRLRCNIVTKLLIPLTSMDAEWPNSTAMTGKNQRADMWSIGSTATNSHSPTNSVPPKSPVLAGNRYCKMVSLHLVMTRNPAHTAITKSHPIDSQMLSTLYTAHTISEKISNCINPFVNAVANGFMEGRSNK